MLKPKFTHLICLCCFSLKVLTYLLTVKSETIFYHRTHHCTPETTFYLLVKLSSSFQNLKPYFTHLIKIGPNSRAELPAMIIKLCMNPCLLGPKIFEKRVDMATLHVGKPADISGYAIT